MHPLYIWTYNVTVSTLAAGVSPTTWPGVPTDVKADSITVLLEDSGALVGGRLPLSTAPGGVPGYACENAGRGNGLAAKLFLLYLMEGSDREPFIRTVSSYGDEENIISLATAAGHVGSQRNLLRCGFRVPWRAWRDAPCLRK